MEHRVEFAPEAINDLEDLEQSDSKRVVDKIDWYCRTSTPLRFAKPLSGTMHGLYRFRIREYRALFKVLPDGSVTILHILRVRHRKNVYKRDLHR